MCGSNSRAGAGDQHARHAGGGGGLDAGRRILEDETFFGGHAETTRGFEERIGVGFAARVVFAANDGVEKMADAECLEGVVDDAPVPATGDGERFAPVPFAGEGDDRLDGCDFHAEFEEELLLVLHSLIHRQVVAVALVENFHHARSGHAAEHIKHRFREIISRTAERDLPRLEMRGHRIGKRPVAVENERVKFTGWQFEGERTMFRLFAHKAREDARLFRNGERDLFSTAWCSRKGRHGFHPQIPLSRADF